MELDERLLDNLLAIAGLEGEQREVIFLFLREVSFTGQVDKGDESGA